MIALVMKPGAMRIVKMFESLKVQVQVQDPVLDCEEDWVACRQLALVPPEQFPQ